MFFNHSKIYTCAKDVRILIRIIRYLLAHLKVRDNTCVESKKKRKIIWKFSKKRRYLFKNKSQ